MPDQPAHPPDLLDRYHDDVLEGPQREAFERALQERDAVRRELELQRSIDAALRRVIAVPTIEHLSGLAPTLPAARDQSERGEARRVVFRRRLAVAAALAATVMGTWLTWRALSPAPPSPYDRPWQSLEAVHADAVARNMEPEWICQTDQEFREVFQHNLGHPLQIRDAGPAIELLGLAYRHSLSARTICVLARADGAPVVVAIDTLETDSNPRLDPRSDLSLFRRQIDGLVLYEISTLPEPRLLEQFYDPTAAGPRSGPADAPEDAEP